MLNIPTKLPGIGTTIFTVMSKLAATHQAINLSQGFPDYACNPALITAIQQAMQSGFNQYAPMAGNLALRENIAEKIENLHGVAYHPDDEITITAGGTQAIFTAIAATINPGDEVIIFEPAYDCYAPTVKLFGGLVKSYALHPPDYQIDWNLVKKLFSVKTKMIILNTPHNPTGSILKDEDLKELAKLVKNTDVLILSDEVYEHLIFDEAQHCSVMRYPELKERSFVVASFGKLLHVTGWKIGYCIAPKQLSTEFRKVHQFNVFSVNSAMQAGIAQYLKHDFNYGQVATFFEEKRNYFQSLLANTRFKLLPCKGSYFQCVSYTHFSTEKDIDLCTRLIKDFGVAAIPVSAFYQKPIDNQVIRFCFAKENSTLEQAAEKLSHV